jgi:hypothetical protein
MDMTKLLASMVALKKDIESHPSSEYDRLLNCIANDPEDFNPEVVEAYARVQEEACALIGSNMPETIVRVAKWNQEHPEFRVRPGETDSFGWLSGVIRVNAEYEVVFG